MKNDEPDAPDRALDDALDHALDHALAQYSSEDPLAGLEQRVLHRVRAEAAGPRFGVGRWVRALGFAVTVSLLVAGVWWMRPQPHVAVAGQARSPIPGREDAIETPPPATSHQPPATANAARPRQAGRLVPLSSEERALLAFVARAPNQAREAFMDLQRQSTEPIQVEEIRIEPLRSDHARDDAK
jgi:hypothetical protein